ncbi:Pyruvate dehydrogenase complex repressor [Enterobacter sp. DC4]|uniref:FadR/GntR family transcriptional regulator n=1 Tax=Enterobacter sp. DC4 TaxID=1395580 RepID=UPI0003ED06AC|nr:FadR/GntR family transcriptional regulator [Enterobacter sp. DC4]EWG67274.1 Pyruvate dehydrogenase complex repressor [Enterobacter sp. DC4]
MLDNLFTPIIKNKDQKETLSDLVYNEIRTAIRNDKLRPGDQLPAERQLEKLFLVSRVPIREAIKKLTTEGMLRHNPAGGAIVSDLYKEVFSQPLELLLNVDPQAKRDVLELRRLLEGEAAYYAAQRATAQEHELLTQNYYKLRDAYFNGTQQEAAAADAAFHLSIVHAAHNHALNSIMSIFYTVLESSVLNAADTIRKNEESWNATDNHHKKLLSSIIQGDAEEARRIAREHLNFIYSILTMIR